MSAFNDRRLLARASAALLSANARFWPTIAPLTATHLKLWEQRAHNIKDPALQALALRKLRDERFNAEVATTLATLAPAPHRKATVEAIVAYEVMYDYLDGLTECLTGDPLREGHELYEAFTDAIALDAPPPRGYYPAAAAHDGGYLRALVDTVQQAFACLPSASVAAPAALAAATRCAEAQIRAHAAPVLGTQQLEQWAQSEARDIGLGWQSFLAGAASSVLAVHALIAGAAGERLTTSQAVEIDATYLSTCALSTMLDSLVDYSQDTRAGQLGYIRYYADHHQLAEDLVDATHRAIGHAKTLPDGAHHTMTLVGVAAYYISAPTANSDLAQPVTRHVRKALEPLITPTLAVMRTWRAAKRARAASLWRSR